MKKSSGSESGAFNPRIFAAFILCSVGAWLAMFSFGVPTPSGDTLTATHRTTTYTDSTGAPLNPTPIATGVPNCGPTGALCSTFNLTIDPTVASLSGYQISVQWQWGVSTVDYDWFIEDSGGNVIAKNQSTADPSTIILPITTTPGTYKLIGTLSTGAPIPYTGTITLQPIPSASSGCSAPADCTPPRYQSYSAGPNQADDAGEPSLGVDWNPNVPSLQHDKVNAGGVAFFTSGPHEWRVNFDDCASPAINLWEDVSFITDQQFVLSDPIGFVDHYTSQELGLTDIPPHTPGRVFALDLIGGEGQSLAGYSDDDGNSSSPGGNGGPVAGPDHETLGGGPYAGTPPATASYPASGTKNAIYYCSQNIVAEAQCSRSDDGGITFGPGIPIFNPGQCTGGIHGHVKVAPDGTVYVPNSSCGTVGTTGVAVSTDNGLTWTENNIPNSTSTQDPSVGIGQNHIGEPNANLNGTNTIYLGYSDGDGHAKVVHSGDRGAHWSTPVDVGAAFGVTHAVFPVVVAGDDNRAAFGFLGTGAGISTNGKTCDPYGATLNCANIWHLYIATTYDGGANWITIDATPNDPVQTGTVCLQGTTCAGGRNLLDFNDFAIDREGRGLVGYADGCVNCANSFQGQSSASHGTVTRQSGGRRLFSHFDPVEPAPPAAPQLVSALRQSSGAVITWLEPDNGGSPITSYNIYRGTTSGGEGTMPIATVSGATTTKYLDPAPPAGNVYYYVTAVNSQGQSTHCAELTLAVGPPPEDVCTPPGLTELTDAAGDTNATIVFTGISTPAPPGSDITKLQVSQPYQTDNVPRLVFTITTDSGQSPQAAGSAWYVAMKIGTGYKGVRMAWKATTPTAPVFESYTPGANSSGGVDGRFVTAGSEKALEPTSSYSPPYNQVVLVVKASDLGLNTGGVISGFIVGAEQSSNVNDPGASPGAAGLFDSAPDGLAFTGTYTVGSNQTCRPNTPPVAVLAANPRSGFAPLSVRFDGSGSYDPDTAPPADTIASYHLTFGDGASATCPGDPTCTGTGKANHTYSSPGDYTARLTVTDSRGAASTNTAQQAITVAAAPDLIVSNLTASNNQAPQGSKVTLTATIKNQGTANAVASQTEFLLDNSTRIGLVNTAALAPGASVQVSVDWYTANVKKGQHTIKATADKNNAVAESKENNNTTTITVNIQGNKT